MPARSSGPVKVALIQMRCNLEPPVNLDRAAEKIREAAARGARVICLPELFKAYYFCQAEEADRFDLAEPIPGPTSERFGKLAGELGIVLVVPVFEKRADGLYHNSVVVFDADGRSLGVYRKMHIPDDPLYYEKFYFTPGDLGFKVFDTRFGRIGVLICWDQWFPEGARLTAMQGAQILFYPTAIGWLLEEKESLGDRQHDAWETVQRGHAVANGCFLAAVNRVGTEGNLEFWGRSFLVDPQGQRLVRGGSDEEILLADVDYRQIDETRRLWPFFRDRRIDAYGGMTKRWDD
jgi:N-carbamoylputrescine amidase